MIQHAVIRPVQGPGCLRTLLEKHDNESMDRLVVDPTPSAVNGGDRRRFGSFRRPARRPGCAESAAARLGHTAPP